jgi:hypothetical protein
MVRSWLATLATPASARVPWGGIASPTPAPSLPEPHEALAVAPAAGVPAWAPGDVPGPGPGGEGCAALLGGAAALSSIFTATNAHDAIARARIIGDPGVTARLSTMRGDDPPLFAPEFARMHPYWIAAAITVLEHETIAETRASDIGGYPLRSVLPAAIALAGGNCPFDRIVPALERLAASDGDSGP